MSEQTFEQLLRQYGDAKFDLGLSGRSDELRHKADSAKIALLAMWNTRKPEPGQPAADFIEVDGIHVDTQWVRDIRGKLADTDYKLQQLEAKQPAAGQSEPIAWMTKQTRNGKKILEIGEATTNKAYTECHKEWLWIPLYTIPAAPAVPEISDVEALISEVARLSGAVCGAMKNWETIQARERRLLPLEQVLIAVVRLLGYWGAMAITVQSKDIISELYPLISNLKDAVFLVEIQVKNENSEAARVARIVEDAMNRKQAPIHPAPNQQGIHAVPDELMKLFYSWWGNQINDSDYFNQMQRFFDPEKSNRMLVELPNQQGDAE